ATAGGCLLSKYLAAWVISKLSGKADAESAIHYVAPVGEKESMVKHCMSVVGAYL
ncbi:AraC family transcriptional regulator, partial [Vibrio parahaemolyticus]